MLANNAGSFIHRRKPSLTRLRRPSADSHISTSDAPRPYPTLTSPIPRLAKLRAAILDHLKDLETRLSQLESPLKEMWEECSVDRTLRSPMAPPKEPKARLRTGSFSVGAIDDARARIRDGLEMLDRIRADVCSHLPELSGFDFSLPELDLHLPSTPSLEDLNFDNFQSPLSYLPTLTTHLDTLHEHLLSLQLPSSIKLNFPTPSPNGRISELLYKLQDPDLFTDPLKSPLDFLVESRKPPFDPAELEKQAASQIESALKKSLFGERLLLFQDLPHRYQNNEHVLSGYRFIPLYQWPLLLLSIFRLHNETANIWTHLIPLTLALMSLSSPVAAIFKFAQTGDDLPIDIAERTFSLFAMICLASSCVWHVMAGCAHTKATDTAARIDYVGIGWLISASIGSVVYYGFGCRPTTAAFYLIITFCLGIAGSILPFMTWFNERKNKNYRLLFFLSLAFTLLIPVAHLAAIHSFWDMYAFIQAEIPSLASYATGLLFYAFHIPERLVPAKWAGCLDWAGGGSHAIWHLFIVLAIKLHKDAMIEYRHGIGNEMCQLHWEAPSIFWSPFSYAT
ncbi:HlyIII-domain-containing protein [Hysterangium stoloniferum]|nr:HlyIII-domain-containing protein [Hysterangium stoloniferum]